MTLPVDLSSVSAITISGIPVKKISIEGQQIWTPAPVNLNDQVPYTVPFLVVGPDAPPPPPTQTLALVSVTADTISVAASGTPLEEGFEPVGFNFYLDDVKQNVSVDADGLYDFTGLDDDTAYEVAFTFVDALDAETVKYGTRTVTTVALSQEIPPETASAIDGLVTSKIAAGAGNWNGCILGVKKAGQWEYLKAYGTDRNTPMTVEKNGRYGSNTKMYTHMLILKRVNDGWLSLNDTVDQFITGVIGGDRITIKHLIMMQSGLGDFLQSFGLTAQNYFLKPTQPANPMVEILGQPLLYEPGNVPNGFSPFGNGSYSNNSTFLLGRILEVLDAAHGTSRNVRTIFYEDLLAPLGLDETEWPAGVYPKSPYFRAYAYNFALPQIQAILGPLYPLAGLLGYPTSEEVEWTAVHPSYCEAAGILGGTIADAVKFGEILADDTLRASEDWLGPELAEIGKEVFHTYLPYTPSGTNGPGLMLFTLGGWIQYGQWRMWNGNLGGYICIIAANPNTGDVVASMGNYMQGSISNIILSQEIIYLLDPGSMDSLPPPVIRPLTIEASGGGWVGEPGVYVYQVPTNTVPLPVPAII